MNAASAQQGIMEQRLRMGGGEAAIEKQHRKGRLTARERIDRLVDPGALFFELGLWAAWGLYPEWGGAPSAGLVCGIGKVAARRHMIIANDATVKAGSFFPMTVKKLLRAQHIALAARLPILYLVDSAGVFLPLQDEVFPDQDDFGRIFRNNAVISAEGIPQTAAIMGPCVAGGAYLPVMCDRVLMTEGSGLYIAGPSLVKAAIGQQIESEDLGGAKLHASLSGTVDFREPDDAACIARLRELSEASRIPLSKDKPWSAAFEEIAAVQGDPLLVRRLGQGTVDALLIAVRDGVGSAPMDSIDAALNTTDRAPLVVLECRVKCWTDEDHSALARIAFNCRRIEARVLLDIDFSGQPAALHWTRAPAPALVLTPYSDPAVQAGSRLWADVLYSDNRRAAVLAEAAAVVAQALM
jgi:hypothetical protein